MTTSAKPKIQLPWIVEDLEAQKAKELKTRQFWRVSRIWNGFGPACTVHSAISQLNNVICNLDPERPLAQRSASLLDLIVTHGSKPKRKHSNSNEELSRMTVL